MSADICSADEYEALIQFLYVAPVGLVQTSIDGDIAMINPVSAQLLMPLSPDGSLENLFTTLASVAPGLRQLTTGFTRPRGLVCDALHVALPARSRGASAPEVLSVSVLKLDESRLMAVLSDVTPQVKLERLRRQNEAWFNVLLTDYAVVNLDEQGCVTDWNSGLGRVTGFTHDAVFGQPCSVFCPDDAITPGQRVPERLCEAHESGLSMFDGWHTKADGTRFWGSSMIAPVLERQDPSGGFSAAADEHRAAPAYRLIIRDINAQAPASLA